MNSTPIKYIFINQTVMSLYIFLPAYPAVINAFKKLLLGAFSQPIGGNGCGETTLFNFITSLLISCFILIVNVLVVFIINAARQQVIPQYNNPKPFDLSGGENKILAFSVGLIYRPKLLLYNESITGMELNNSFYSNSNTTTCNRIC